MRDLDINMDMMDLIGYMNRVAEKTRHGYIPKDVAYSTPGFMGYVMFDNSHNLSYDPDGLTGIYKMFPQPSFLINGEEVLFTVEYDLGSVKYDPCVFVYIGDYERDKEPSFIIDGGSWYNYEEIER